jgi:putative radical SAM enzyme (TIGR03279 family)
MLRILEVKKGTIADKLGMETDDSILEIDKKPVRDEIDFRFLSAGEKITLKVLQSGKVKEYKIKKSYDDTLGFVFEEMKMYSCGTDCIFCFITQNPKGLRESLYFQDGDYRMSFLYGNYITLTNVGPNALKRIAEQKLSPLYISVHSTTPEVRTFYMNLKGDDGLMDKITYLVNNGIRIHTQIVLSPEINDGKSLLKTIDDLYALKEGIESLAIVPVGLTKHRKNLPKIKKVTGKYAKDIISFITPIQQKIKSEIGINWVYLSDEFYLLSREELPKASYYDDYPQIENGVGMIRIFYDDFIKSMKRAPKKLSEKKVVSFITGALPYEFMMNNVIPKLNGIENLKVNLYPITNTLFGSSVTVSGLLSEKCLLKGLKGKKLGDLVVLPDNIINHEGVFLDDGNPEEFSKKIKRPVLVFDNNWRSFFKYVENL